MSYDGQFAVKALQGLNRSLHILIRRRTYQQYLFRLRHLILQDRLERRVYRIVYHLDVCAICTGTDTSFGLVGDTYHFGGESQRQPQPHPLVV